MTPLFLAWATSKVGVAKKAEIVVDLGRQVGEDCCALGEVVAMSAGFVTEAVVKARVGLAVVWNDGKVLLFPL